MDPVLGFVRNPVKVSVGVLIVALFGAIALFRMPMQLVPEVQIPTIKIETFWPGASPMEVEREIVQEQEEQLKGVGGMTKLSSASSDSRGEVTLEFAVGTDMAEALLKVNSRLQQVREYPQEAREPVLTTSAGSEQPIAWFVLRPRMPSAERLDALEGKHPELAKALAHVRSAHKTGLAFMRLREAANRHPAVEKLLPTVDVSILRDFTEDVVETRFERVAGVAAANVFGGRERELKIIVDPHRLAARNVTIAQVRLALQGRNKDTSAGDFWEGKRRYVVRTLGQFKSPTEVEGVLLARRDGVPIYVRDVAQVRLGHKKADAVVRNFGTECVAVNAEREAGSNVLQVMEGLREAADELNAGVLKDRDLELVQVYDETDYIYSAVNLVGENAVWGAILTVAVLLIFLRSARSTLVIGLAIPTSIIGAFLLLSLMGRSLNVISMAGMAFAIGMLVDNAVVVLENIFRHFQMGKKPYRAAVEGTQEVWGAVVASTLTTLAVFLPVLFVEEEAGQFFRDIALAISCSVGLSLLVSVTLIPTATARVLSEKQARVSEPGGALGRLGVRALDLIVGINRFLQGNMRRQLATVVVLVVAAIAGTWLLIPKVEYLPEGNRNIVFGFVIPPPGYNLDELYAVGSHIQDSLRPYYDIDPEGPEAEELDGPVIADFFVVAAMRRVFMGFRAHDPLRAGELVPIAQRALASVPGVYAYVAQGSLFGRGLTAGRTIDVEIRGPQLERLVGLGLRVMGAVRQEIPGSQVVPKSSLEL
ncbi:MAG: efflux RND transporter permease subunit, partial [Planctomycetota bacterium]